MYNFIVIPLFCIEIYLSSVSTFYEDIFLVKKIQVVVKRYLKGYFFIDFLGTFPFFAIGPKHLLAFKLFRIVKMQLYLSRINSLVYISLSGYLHSRKELLINIQKTVRFLILLILTMHLFACIWIWLGNEHLLGDPNNNFDLYVAAVYWVMTTFTTVGYGDFHGQTNAENIFQLIAIFVGIGFFGYIIGNVR
jgi:hypothetical protein